jgi:hypothetical protein
MSNDIRENAGKILAALAGAAFLVACGAGYVLAKFVF